MKGFPDLPPIWWVGSMAIIYLAKWLLPEAHLAPGTLDIAARIIQIVALGIILWAALWFWRKKTPIEPHYTPKTLIIEGPYRLSRNPIYLALVLITLSSAINHGSVIGLVATAALWTILDRRFAAKEEALLLQTFPEAAPEYLRETRRWI